MSSTILYRVPKSGTVEEYRSWQNGFGSAFRIWYHVIRQYQGVQAADSLFSSTGYPILSKLFRQFWFLEGDPRDQIPFLLTADRLILEQTRFLEVAALLRDFEQFYPEKLSHLPGIADALTELADAPDTAGACFVWTTCSTDAWMVPDDGYHRRYRHPDDQEQYGSFFLFDELKRCQSIKNQEPARNPV